MILQKEVVYRSSQKMLESYNTTVKLLQNTL
jgi:hypothetical protein